MVDSGGVVFGNRRRRRHPDLFPLQWLAPSRSPQRSRSSCLYQPSLLKLKSNVRKKSYVIDFTSYNEALDLAEDETNYVADEEEED